MNMEEIEYLFDRIFEVIGAIEEDTGNEYFNKEDWKEIAEILEK